MHSGIFDSYDHAFSVPNFGDVSPTLSGITEPFFDPFLITSQIADAFWEIPDLLSPQISISIAESLNTFSRMADFSNDFLLSGSTVADHVFDFFENISSFLETEFEEEFENNRRKIQSYLNDICNAEQSATTPSEHCIIKSDFVRFYCLLFSLSYLLFFQ